VTTLRSAKGRRSPNASRNRRREEEAALSEEEARKLKELLEKG
jgi:hypothetical protein